MWHLLHPLDWHGRYSSTYSGRHLFDLHGCSATKITLSTTCGCGWSLFFIRFKIPEKMAYFIEFWVLFRFQFTKKKSFYTMGRSECDIHRNKQKDHNQFRHFLFFIPLISSIEFKTMLHFFPIDTFKYFFCEKVERNNEKKNSNCTNQNQSKKNLCQIFTICSQ